MHAGKSSRAGTTLENEAEDAVEEHEPIPEQAGESPDEPDGAEEGESAPTHDAADSYDEAEEDEGAAERESRRDDPDRQEGHRASHAAQQDCVAKRSSAVHGSEEKGAGTSDRPRVEEDDGGNPARPSGSGTREERRAPRASRGGGTSGPERSRARPSEVAGAREGGTRREAHLSASGGTEGAKGDGRHTR
ncbi:unnamed protein product [Closterium sp. Naga37s-1]|nr:unnamed protein product [Closterium sp. Naga37s-1]